MLLPRCSHRLSRENDQTEDLKSEVAMVSQRSYTIDELVAILRKALKLPRDAEVKWIYRHTNSGTMEDYREYDVLDGFNVSMPQQK